MRLTTPSQTHALTLESVIARLSQRPEVDGVMVIGSKDSASFRTYSDYDLLLILNETPVPLTLVTTQVDGRMAEFLVTNFKAIDQIMTSNNPVPSSSQAARIIYWLQHGKIHFDRTGKLAIGQKLLAVGDWVNSKPGRAKLYGRWQNSNYNIAQNRRMLQADDPVYQTAVDLRFLHMCSALWSDYFLVRGIPGRGEKQEIRYLEEHDASFLEKFRELLACDERNKRQQLYESLASQVFAPFAPMWEEGVTSVAFDRVGRWRAEYVGEALQFWHRLVGFEPSA